MVRVLHLRSSGGLLGAENVILEISRLGHEHGIQATIGAIHHRGDPYPHFVRIARRRGIECVIFGARTRFDYQCIRSIASYVRSRSMDMIHCHGYKEDLYGLLAARNCRRIATNHLWKCASWRSRAYARLDSAVLRGFHRIVGVSDEIVRTMHARGLGKAVKIANGVDCELFAPRTKDRALIHRYDLSRSGPVFGMASSLTSVKGHRYALHAFARLKSELPGAKLLIAGEGSERGAIEQTLRERGVADSVRLTGTIDNMPRFLSVIDMFVLPSLNEGLPMALLEAMASAKPVIAARVGEIPRVIDHGTTGLLIDPANEQDLYAGMRTLGRCRRLRRTMGARARQRVIEHYSSRRMTRAYADLYAAACGRKSH